MPRPAHGGAGLNTQYVGAPTTTHDMPTIFLVTLMTMAMSSDLELWPFLATRREYDE